MSLTLLIILLTAAVSIPAFSNPSLFYRLDFNPHQIEKEKEWHRFLTHAFLHADWWHLIVNMLVLYFFGDVVQQYFGAYTGGKGAFYFLLLYLGGILVAVVPTYQKHKDNPGYHSVGASGAVSAVVFSSVVFSPGTDLCLYGLICLPGIIWAIIYLIYSYTQAKKGGDYINHDAHFWGAVYGIVFTFLAVPKSISAFFSQLWGILPF
jgi:membrane associated rhomboid family serine protease